MKTLEDFRNIRVAFGLANAIRMVAVPALLERPQLKHKEILDYLGRRYTEVIDKYKTSAMPLACLAPDCPIWICWFQGENNMPAMVKECLRSVRGHCGMHEVHVITMDNFWNWISIPGHVMDKINRKEITLTHFSDIVRNALLAEQGGIWLDATIYLTDELKGWNLPFYTIKQGCPADHKFVSEYMWTGFCMGGVKGNPLNSFVMDALYEYHRKERGLIDYFLIDYMIALGYNTVSTIKKLVDDVPCSNPGLYYMQHNMGKPTDESRLKKVCEGTSVFKLNYKIDVPCDNRSLYYYLGFGAANDH